MSTVQEILDRGFARSFKNRPDTIATNPTEMVSVVDRLQKEMFALAAEENPEYFGTATQVAPAAGAWARPANAESIIRIQKANGAEVVVVPIDQRDAEKDYTAAVYEWGRFFYPAGATASLDPNAASDVLTFYFSEVPATLTALGDALDSRWPSRFDAILELGVAHYLAVKDGRAEEAVAVEGERGRWIGLFIQHLQHATANLVRPTRIPRGYLVKRQEPRSGGRQ